MYNVEGLLDLLGGTSELMGTMVMAVKAQVRFTDVAATASIGENISISVS